MIQALKTDIVEKAKQGDEEAMHHLYALYSKAMLNTAFRILNNREDAEINGYTVVESPTVLTTHLTELLRRNSHKLLTRQDVKNLIENLKEDYPVLVDEAKPENLPLLVIQNVLKNLLKEGIPIRDLPIILESILEYYKVTQNVDVLVEYVRHNISETIKKLYEDQNGIINAIAVDPFLEDTMTKALASGNNNALTNTLGMSPEIIGLVHKSLQKSIDDMTEAGYLPLIICSAQIRPYFYKMISSSFQMINVISYTELPAEAEINIVASVKPE